MYYQLDWKVIPTDPELANTESSPDLDIPWTMGMYYSGTLPEPIICNLNPNRGKKMRDVFLTDIPLFSERFLSVLSESGVDNIQTYSAELHHPDGEIYTNYKAVNIIGLVECANLELSSYMPGRKPPIMRFSELVIKENDAFNLDFFRLGEDSLVILLSERLKENIDRAQLMGFTLVPVKTISK